MDSEHTTAEDRRNQQVDNAIRAIQEKKPVPEIDFTIHTMEDGTQVSTMERVCKGTSVCGSQSRTYVIRYQVAKKDNDSPTIHTLLLF